MEPAERAGSWTLARLAELPREGTWVAEEPVRTRGRAVAPWGLVDIDLSELLEQ